MEIKVAEHAGFCFGVRNAVDTAYALAEDKPTDRLVTWGPIIHNERVVDELAARGVTPIESMDELSAGTTVLIRSHGVAASVLEELNNRSVAYSDCTCPFVKKIQMTVREHSKNGDEIVIIGSLKHPEVQGILGWSLNGGTVIETAEQAEAYNPLKSDVSVCVVAQTTFNSKKFQDFVEIFSKKEYNINVVNTICQATQVRQDEAAALAEASQAMIVIGGRMSSNSKKLYDICKMRCENTFFIQTAAAVEDLSFEGIKRLGITAGASTPKTLIQEVLEACQKK